MRRSGNLEVYDIASDSAYPWSTFDVNPWEKWSEFWFMLPSAELDSLSRRHRVFDLSTINDKAKGVKSTRAVEGTLHSGLKLAEIDAFIP